MPIMARTSAGIYKAVSDIYDTQGNAISTVYDNDGNTVFSSFESREFGGFSAYIYDRRTVKNGYTRYGGDPVVVLITDINGNPIYNKDVKGKKLSCELACLTYYTGAGTYRCDGYKSALVFTDSSSHYSETYTTEIEPYATAAGKKATDIEQLTDVIIPASKNPNNDCLYLFCYDAPYLKIGADPNGSNCTFTAGGYVLHGQIYK